MLLRTKALGALGLKWEQVHERWPHLVFAHLTAWGRTGPDQEFTPCLRKTGME